MLMRFLRKFLVDFVRSVVVGSPLSAVALRVRSSRKFLADFTRSARLVFAAAVCLAVLSCGGGGEAAGDGDDEAKVLAATEKFARHLSLYIPENHTVAARRGGRDGEFISGEFFLKDPEGGEAEGFGPVGFLLTSDGKTVVVDAREILERDDLEDAGVPGFRAIPQQAARAPLILVSDDGRIMAAAQLLKVGTDSAALNREQISLDGALVIGNENARVTIVEYSDFQCPYCAQASGFVRDIISEYGGRVRLVYKQFPLSFHKWAYGASEVSYCFQKLGGNPAFGRFHDEVFAGQELITVENSAERFAEIAFAAGIDPEELGRCAASGEMKKRVDKDISEARALGVEGTPSFFIDGMRVPNDPALMRKAIDIRLSEVH